MNSETQQRLDRLRRGLDKLWDITRPAIHSGPTVLPGFDWYIAPEGNEQMDDKQVDPIWDMMYQLHQALQAAKPAERNELARAYAVTITELEKVMAYYDLWVYRFVKATEGEQ